MIQIKLISTNSQIKKIYIQYLKKYLPVKTSIINLPTKKSRISLLKSPHVNKKAQEQFEQKIFKSIITIKSTFSFKFLKVLFLNKPTSIKLNVTTS